MVFDLLRDGGEDLRGQPLAARRLRLQQRLHLTPALRRVIRLSEVATDDGHAMLARAKHEGWEGLIVKDGQSVYQSGRRTPAWRKLKLLKQQEFVVGGWTEPRLSRQHFGALLLGYYEGRALRWAGSVGTGFDQAELDRLSGLLSHRHTPTSPFADPVKTQERAPLGDADADRGDSLHRVDLRRPPSPAGLPGPAHRQEGHDRAREKTGECAAADRPGDPPEAPGPSRP